MAFLLFAILTFGAQGKDLLLFQQGKDLLRAHRAVSYEGDVQASAEEINIYGEALVTCDKTGGAAGSSQSDGKCDEKDGGIHSLCVSSLPGDFSETTGQGDWTESEKGKPWCVCIGAWSLYHAKGKDVKAHCDAIPDFVLGPDYINNWSTWNGNELDDQIIDGINDLYDQCAKGQSGSKLEFLKKKYCSIASTYKGKEKQFATTDEFKNAGC